MEKFIKNQTTTGCGPCPYLSSIGECSWGTKCSHQLSYTYNNIDDNVTISPIPWMDKGVVYINDMYIDIWEDQL